MKPLFFVYLLTLTLIGCTAGTDSARTEITISNSTSFIPKQIQAIGDVINAFRDVCPDLFKKYWDDIVEANLVIRDPCCWRADTFGWTKEAYLTVKVDDDPKTIPASFRANGHTLHYFLGNGRESGITAKKEQSQLVCGFTPHDDGRDTFVSALALSALAVF